MVHFNFAFTKSNFLYNLIAKTFIMMSQEAIVFTFNLSHKAGIIYEDWEPLSNKIQVLHMTDKFSVRVTKITSRIGISWTQ